VYLGGPETGEMRFRQLQCLRNRGQTLFTLAKLQVGSGQAGKKEGGWIALPW
jgi:hypothetical protein